MRRTRVVFFKDADGSVPVREWLLREVGRHNPAALAKCRAALDLLRERGRDLRRPYADYLRDGIYELRVRLGSVNYRLLYFFSGSIAAVVAHGLTKEAEVPAKEIGVALTRKKLFETEPERYYAEEEED